MSKATTAIIPFTILFVCTTLAGGADPPQGDDTNPGLPLDGSIVIDESIWASLLGEPGQHMSDAYQDYLQGNLTDASNAVRKASSFLLIASSNAFEGPSASVHAAAEELEDLRERIAEDKVKSDQELKAVFGRAHLAMSRHHLAKAAAAIKQQRWALASNYLRSAASHFQRASYWTGHELRAGTIESIAEAKKTAKNLGSDDAKAIGKAGRLIESLGERIERFGKSLSEHGAKTDSQIQPQQPN